MNELGINTLKIGHTKSKNKLKISSVHTKSSKNMIINFDKYSSIMFFHWNENEICYLYNFLRNNF